MQGSDCAAPPERRGDWMETYSGRKFWPLDPRPEDFHVIDIARPLSMQARYAGHTIHHYSVAQHSVLLTEYAQANHLGSVVEQWCLVHDAPEAFLCDIPRPLKRFLSEYQVIEDRMMAAIAEWLDLPSMPPIVAELDTRILGDERAWLKFRSGHDWGLPPRLGIQVEPWSPELAERNWFRQFRRLFPEVA